MLQITAETAQTDAKLEFLYSQVYRGPPPSSRDVDNHLFYSGKLFHEYLVDSWAIYEQECLNYLRFTQGKLCSDLYSALTTAVQDNSEANPADMGMHIILPSTFTGSTHNMQTSCQDSPALN
jgi:hypothetical protein